MNRAFAAALVLSASSLFHFSTLRAADMTVTVENPGSLSRPAETIEIPWREILSRMPEALPDHLQVKDVSGTPLPVQWLNFHPEDKGGRYDSLLFQHDFAKGEQSATFTIRTTSEPAPPFPSKVSARYVPERFDDFAWENDRVAHRIYGPGLATPEAGKSKMTSSGIDVWCKRVRYPIVDRWYLKSHDNYHKDTGEGLDMYDVGTARGCGGTGIWNGETLHVSGNWASWKVLANGPVRAVFELTYAPWDCGGFQAAETKRFTVDAGHHLDRIESTFYFSGTNRATVAIGLGKHAKAQEELTENKEQGWMTLWETYREDGQLGTAVLLAPGEKPSFAQTKSDHLMLVPAQSGEPLAYYAGAGWDRSGDFASKEEWNAYVSAAAERLASPVRLSYSAETFGNGTASREALTPMKWSERMASSEITRLGETLCAPPKEGWWDYTTGLYADSLIRLSKASGNPAYRQSAEQIIGSFISPTGVIATYQEKKPRKETVQISGGAASASPTPADLPLPKVKVPYSLDDVESGVALLSLHDITGEERYRKAADFIRAQLGKHPRVKEGGFWHKAIYPEQMWLDGLYMGEPFYAGYAARFGEKADFDDVARQFTVMDAHAYDPKTGLLYHGWNESKKQFWANPSTGLSPSFWSRAIGWYVMALVDVLDSVPPDHPSRVTLLALLKKTAEGIIRWQDPATGVWWQVTDQGNRPHNYLESTSSCMFVYALAKGINRGYLPATMTDAIRRGYAGIIRNFVSEDADGTISLTRCCKVAGLGLSKKRDGTFDYYTLREPIVSNDLKGVGPFINAGIECEKLLKGERFAP